MGRGAMCGRPVAAARAHGPGLAGHGLGRAGRVRQHRGDLRPSRRIRLALPHPLARGPRDDATLRGGQRSLRLVRCSGEAKPATIAAWTGTTCVRRCGPPASEPLGCPSATQPGSAAAAGWHATTDVTSARQQPASASRSGGSKQTLQPNRNFPEGLWTETCARMRQTGRMARWCELLGALSTVMRAEFSLRWGTWRDAGRLVPHQAAAARSKVTVRRRL